MRALAADVRSDALAELSETEQEQFITTLIKIKGNLTAMDENANAGKNRDVLSTSVKDGQNG